MEGDAEGEVEPTEGHHNEGNDVCENCGKDQCECGIEGSREVIEDTPAYKQFFTNAMSKFGIKSIESLSDENKKKFFNYVDKNWKSKVESKKNDPSEYIHLSIIKESKKKVNEAIKISQKEGPTHKVLVDNGWTLRWERERPDTGNVYSNTQKKGYLNVFADGSWSIGSGPKGKKGKDAKSLAKVIVKIN
jgi:nitrogen fixation protein